MTGHLTDRYLAAKRIALGAADLAGDARERFLAAEVHGDAPLEKEVRWMLEAMERTEPVENVLLTALATPDLSGRDAEVTTSRHYRLLRRLGEGGTGVVYLAERDDGGYVQQVALKMLGVVAEGSPIQVERFARERQLLALLEHPGIARLLDGGVLSNGKPFLAMEYVEGERIDHWCEKRALDLNGRIALFLKVCAAVEYAHGHLVIHRDLKPANILVTASGEPKLLDFGIARLLDDDAPDGLTQTGQHAMSVAYASPEQIACHPLATSTDVYSLGAVLYQLVSGSTPFGSTTTPVELMNAILGTDALPPSFHGADDATRTKIRVPADIDAIVLKALRKKPQERYESAAAFAADLRRHLDLRPVRARQGQRWYRASRFIRRNRWPLVAAGLVLAVGAGVLIDRARYLQQVETERNKALALSGFMTEMFANGAPNEEQGNKVTVREVLDKGVASLLGRTDLGPAVKGNLLLAIGDTYLSMHLFKEAKAPLLAARKLLDRARAPLEDRVKAIQQLALAASMLGENAEGISLSREGQQLLAVDRDRHLHRWLDLRALELDNQNSQGAVSPQVLMAQLRELIATIRTDADPKAELLLGNAYNTLAVVQERAGKFDDALASMRIALHATDRDGNPPEDRLTMRANYVRMLIAHGDRAEGVIESRALDREYVRLLGPDTMQRAILLSNQSTALANLGRDEEALSTGAEALEVALRTGGQDNRFYLQLAVSHAMDLTRSKRFMEAKKLLLEVLPRLKAKVGEGTGDVNYAYALNALGMVQMKGERDLQAGLKTFRLSEQVLGDKAGEYLVVYHQIPYYSAWAYQTLHKPAEVANELDRYQAVVDANQEPVDSPWRKQLAELREALAEAAEKQDAG